MQSINVPTKFPVIFAAEAGSSYARDIPVASQVAITPGAASLTDGFPPVNFIPLAAGGIPPSGQDFNGILRQLSAWAQWVSAGGSIVYDAGFQTAIGGYPLGARIESAVTAGVFFRSTVENNTSNPDAGGAGWVNESSALSTEAATRAQQDQNLLDAINAEIQARENADANLQAQINAIRFPSSGVSYLGAGYSVFTVPGGVHVLKVTVTGGGAGGCGSDGNQAGAGGGAGGTAIGYVAVAPGQQYGVTVGGSGASGYNSGGSQYNSGGGGTSSFSNILSATGGGPAGQLAGSPGGTGYGGFLQIEGGCGTDASQSADLYGGIGGSSFWGGGGRAATADGSNAINGRVPGSGGGGGYHGAGYGGAGAVGCVVIEF